MKLSSRHGISNRKLAAVEPTQAGIGVSTSARLYWKKQFHDQEAMLGTNEDINSAIAMEYSSATPMTRFWLRSGEPAEVRKSRLFVLVAVIRANDVHDVIVLQPAYKEAPEEIRKQRLSLEWLKKKRK